MLETISNLWPYISHVITIGLLLIDIGATCHIVLNKRDPRAAMAWVGFIWLVPIAGSFLYLWLGINRIRRRARRLRETPRSVDIGLPPAATIDPNRYAAWEPSMARLVRAVDRVTGNALVGGNSVEPLSRHSAFPRMLEAIRAAQRSIGLTTYIFDNDETGREFAEALGEAVARGVAVRVLIDDVGAKYSWPSIFSPLRRRNVLSAAFLPKFTPWAFPYANLRNHRKLLLIDGERAFTGGMNIRDRQGPRAKIAIVDDMHFELQGPIVYQLMHTFVDDWEFTTGESLHGPVWQTSSVVKGDVLCRGISTGPDEQIDQLRLTIAAALACAERSVVVITPYFLPDRDLITALNLAALRGVAVDILLPARSNLHLVQWASQAQLWQILQLGCRVWFTEGPFDHTKLMIVDDAWTLLGSANWDPRSLRLNFECNVECYDQQLVRVLRPAIDERFSRAKPTTLADVDGRPLRIKLRDGLARLLTPYL